MDNPTAYEPIFGGFTSEDFESKYIHPSQRPANPTPVNAAGLGSYELPGSDGTVPVPASVGLGSYTSQVHSPAASGVIALAPGAELAWPHGAEGVAGYGPDGLDRYAVRFGTGQPFAVGNYPRSRFSVREAVAGLGQFAVTNPIMAAIGVAAALLAGRMVIDAVKPGRKNPRRSERTGRFLRRR